MKMTLALLSICTILILGYVAYSDAQARKRQELMKVVQDAEHSLNVIQQHPNSVQNANLTAYQRRIQ